MNCYFPLPEESLSDSVVGGGSVAGLLASIPRLGYCHGFFFHVLFLFLNSLGHTCWNFLDYGFLLPFQGQVLSVLSSGTHRKMLS